MIPASRTNDLARALLVAVIDYYQEVNVALPPRRYISSGVPALDCEQLTIHAERAFPNNGDITAQTAQPITMDVGHSLRTMTYVISLWRCAPTIGDSGLPPAVAEEEAAAALVHADSIHLFNALLDAEDEGGLPLGCNVLAILDWVAVGPEGGLVGGYLSVWVGLG